MQRFKCRCFVYVICLFILLFLCDNNFCDHSKSSFVFCRVMYKVINGWENIYLVKFEIAMNWHFNFLITKCATFFLICIGVYLGRDVINNLKF